MGIDPVHILNHGIHFNHTDALIQQLEERTGLPVFVETNYRRDKEKNIKSPDDFKGWVVTTEDGLSLQESFEKNELTAFRCKNVAGMDCSLLIGSFLLNISGDDFYLGRWQQVCDWCNYMSEEGIPPSVFYPDLEKFPGWLFGHRKKIFEFAQQIGSTAMVTLCDDKHPGWYDFVSRGKTFDELEQWGRREFIFYNFQDLPAFDFPEDEKSGYYNVFILDDFDDLRQSEIKWKQPFHELYFNCRLSGNISFQVRNDLVHSLVTEAARWKIFVFTAIKRGVLHGHAFFSPKDFSIHLLQHFIQSFFKKRGLVVQLIERLDK